MGGPPTQRNEKLVPTLRGGTALKPYLHSRPGGPARQT
jgi:hypothetical protein